MVVLKDRYCEVKVEVRGQGIVEVVGSDKEQESAASSVIGLRKGHGNETEHVNTSEGR